MHKFPITMLCRTQVPCINSLLPCYVEPKYHALPYHPYRFKRYYFHIKLFPNTIWSQSCQTNVMLRCNTPFGQIYSNLILQCVVFPLTYLQAEKEVWELKVDRLNAAVTCLDYLISSSIHLTSPQQTSHQLPFISVHIYLFIYITIYLPIYIYCIYLSTYLLTYLFIYLSI